MLLEDHSTLAIILVSQAASGITFVYPRIRTSVFSFKRKAQWWQSWDRHRAVRSQLAWQRSRLGLCDGVNRRRAKQRNQHGPGCGQCRGIRSGSRGPAWIRL